jgi:hypothetical protein
MNESDDSRQSNESNTTIIIMNNFNNSDNFNDDTITITNQTISKESKFYILLNNFVYTCIGFFIFLIVLGIIDVYCNLF